VPKHDQKLTIKQRKRSNVTPSTFKDFTSPSGKATNRFSLSAKFLSQIGLRKRKHKLITPINKQIRQDTLKKFLEYTNQYGKPSSLS
jgi:hypothetical protein